MLRLTELRYCRAEDDEAVTTVAEADVTALAQGWPVREFAWHPHQGNYPGRFVLSPSVAAKRTRSAAEEVRLLG